MATESETVASMRGEMLKVERAETLASGANLGRIEHAWLELQQQVPMVPLFLTFEWVSVWWRHFGENLGLWLLAVTDGAGRVRGLAPLVLRVEGRGPLRVRRLTFAGAGIAQPAHLDVLAQPIDKNEVSRAVIEFLRERTRDWDVVDLEGLAEDSRLNTTLGTEHRRHATGPSAECRFALLPGAWPEYEARQLSSKMRGNLRSQRRRLDHDHPKCVSFLKVREEWELDAAVKMLHELHRKRWEGRVGATPLDHPRFAAFFRDFASAALDRGWLRFYQLRLADQVIGVNYCFCYRGVYYGYQKAFDPDWARYGPGQLLQAHVIQQAIEEGVREFDMLHGEQADKRVWASDARREVRARYWLRRKGGLYVRALSAYERAKPSAQRVIPQRMQSRVERIAFIRSARA